MMSEIEYRPLHTLDEMRVVVQLQRTYWGEDTEAAIPAHMLLSLANHGGHVIGALDDTKLIGAVIGFIGTSTRAEDSDRPAMTNLQLVSKRMVVLPEYRNQGVGYHLKLEQRKQAIKQGIRLITWTFDPLLAANAYFNIRKLGAITHVYYENYYGTTESGGLTTLGSSDRLLVEWWVTNQRVKERINGDRSNLNLRHYLEANTTILNPTTVRTGGIPWPPETIELSSSTFALLEIPSDYRAIVHTDESLAQAWRLHIRGAFLTLLSRGYLVTDFVHEEYEGRDRAFYLLSHNNPQHDFSLN
ncbi:MAG: GNAT family N-acetyltransferase [Chloroflexi bacterium]|nr:MAG: GNAT family N-acetyltransferase [Chloroflexota bacterium]